MDNQMSLPGSREAGDKHNALPMSSDSGRTRAPTCVDLFCGAGGFSDGFVQANFSVIAANDSDPAAGATFELNHRGHGTAFVLGDIGERKVQEGIMDVVRERTVDTVIGGPPCQAFSQVRNHKRVIDDPRNSLYCHYVSMIRRIKPRVFVMENVPGLGNLAGGAVRRQVIEDLALDGEYRVDSCVLDAADFGVPQNRPRIIFVGVRDDLGIFPRFPIGTGYTRLPKLKRLRAPGNTRAWGYEYPSANDFTEALEELLDPKCTALVTAQQAIGDLEFLEPSPKLLRRPSDDTIEYETTPRSKYQELRRFRSNCLYNADVPSIREDTVKRLAAIPEGGNFRDLPEELAARYLNGKKWGPELGRKNLSRKYFFAYRKLHTDHFSWTLNTKADCVYHYAKSRALTVREFARLHSFDDNYHFLFGDRHSRYRQVGNAVPPLLAKAIGETVKSILAEHDAAQS